MIFPLPAGNSRRRRRLKNPGASAPGFTGVWGRSATNKHAPVYTGGLLAAAAQRSALNFQNFFQIYSSSIRKVITIKKYTVVIKTTVY